MRAENRTDPPDARPLHTTPHHKPQPHPQHQGRTLVCTIHQPSYKVFQLFDRLVLLSLGATVYAGPISRVEPYFAALGYETPHGDNPGECVCWVGVVMDGRCGSPSWVGWVGIVVL
jgi:hypothetical protein